MSRCDVAFSGHPFIGLKGKLLPFPIFIRLCEIKFNIWMYFQNIYIAVIVRVIKEKLKVF